MNKKYVMLGTRKALEINYPSNEKKNKGWEKTNKGRTKSKLGRCQIKEKF